MKILAIAFVYNEIAYMPLKIEWAKENNVDLYIIDNMSNDGTWQYLQRNNIQGHRLDTKDSFDLRLLQSEVEKIIHKLKPDWIVYHGADLFYCTNTNLRYQIQLADKQGFNLIETKFLSFFNTGEKPLSFDPFNTYKYYKQLNNLKMIAKYHPSLKLDGDLIVVPNPKAKLIPGFVANYGQTKTAAEREETKKRREKAWSEGMKSNYGNHYRKGSATGWTWNKSILHSIIESEFYDYWLPLLKLGQKNPLINILIRTSNRPKYFKRLLNSINSQDYKNINLIISADNKPSEKYVKDLGYDPVSVTAIPRDKSNTFPYNLYLNKLLDRVKSGWVHIIDDDDMYPDDCSLSLMASILASGKDNNLFVWQMQWPNGRIIPETEFLHKVPFTRKHISMQCFAFHSRYKSMRFDGQRAGDFRFINALANNCKVIFYPEILIKLTNTGLNGQKIDLS